MTRPAVPRHRISLGEALRPYPVEGRPYLVVDRRDPGHRFRHVGAIVVRTGQVPAVQVVARRDSVAGLQRWFRDWVAVHGTASPCQPETPP